MTVRAASHDRSWSWVERFVLAGCATLYATFIARSSVVIDGVRVFTLFDDAMISMRYGRSLARGDGLVFNQGGEVEGYTNLLWTLLMGAVHTVVEDIRMTSLVMSSVGALLLLGLLLVVRLVVRRTAAEPWAPTVALLAVGTSFALVFWTLRGMEVGLVALLVTSAIAVLHIGPGPPTRFRVLSAGALLTLAVLTRDDAAVIAGAVLLGALPLVPRPDRARAAAWGVLSLGSVVALRVALRWAMYGDVVPNTYRLKVAGVPRAVLLERGGLSTGYLLAFGTAVVVAVACLGWRGSRLARACLLVVAAQLAYALLVGGDAWEDRGFASRFVATVMGPLVIAAVLGLVAAARGDVPRGARLAASAVLAATAAFLVIAPATTPHHQLGQGSPAATAFRGVLLLVTAAAVWSTTWSDGRRAGVVVLAVLIVVAPNALPWARWVADGQPFEDDERRWAEYGLALRAATDERASIAAASIGNIGYFSDRRIVDLLGKIDPEVAGTDPHLERWTLPGHLRWDYQHSIIDLRPDVVAQLFATTPDDIPMIVGSGYRQLGPMTFVREDARIVSDASIRRAASLAR